ncbi:MAG: hypothetical protein V2A72_04900 [Candidatus Omnitrophota bacterium]
MEIVDAPFLKFSPDDLPRPWLPLTILNVVLLGVKSFLSNFILTIDYKQSVFSLQTK